MSGWVQKLSTPNLSSLRQHLHLFLLPKLQTKTPVWHHCFLSFKGHLSSETGNFLQSNHRWEVEEYVVSLSLWFNGVCNVFFFLVKYVYSHTALKRREWKLVKVGGCWLVILSYTGTGYIFLFKVLTIPGETYTGFTETLS